MRVLVIDDEDDLRQVAASFLELLGHEALVAANGHDGLAMILSEGPDAVLLDLRMPGMDGWDVLDALRDHDLLPGLAVIAWSAHADQATVTRARERGCVGYLGKPFTVADLTATLDGLA